MELFFSLSKVYNVPLFTYQVQFSSIQTILPAYISAICGQNPELLSLPASFQAVSTKTFLEKCSLKVFLSGGLTSLWGWTHIFVVSYPWCVGAHGAQASTIVFQRPFF